MIYKEAFQRDKPEPGQLVVMSHKVYRVIELNPVPEVDWTDEDAATMRRYAPEFRDEFVPYYIVLRPVEVDSDDVKARSHDKHYRVSAGSRYRWPVYRTEHYPVCVKCHEPVPCREELGRREAEQAVAKMSRYEDPGLCPSCQEPFTRRQKTHRFTQNIEIPGGSPVTFHMRRQCFSGAYQYEERLAKLDPNYVPQLFCTGAVTNHNDGTYECTAGEKCAGPTVNHQSYQTCDCDTCRSPGGFDCHPMGWAKRRGAEG